MSTIITQVEPGPLVTRHVERSFIARNGTAELVRFDYQGLAEVDWNADEDVVELALTPRAQDAQARYLLPALWPRPIGEVLFVPRGRPLRLKLGQGAWRAVSIRFDMGADDRDGWTEAELYAGLDICSTPVRESLTRLAMEMEAPAFASSLLLEGLCLQVGVALGRYLRQMRAAGVGSSRTLAASQLQAINDRLDAEGPVPSMAAIAAETGLSLRHFGRVFRATTGKALSAYATDRRIARAQFLLLSRDAPIKRVAWACGFETAAAFSAAFRRATGLQPTEYRRLAAP